MAAFAKGKDGMQNNEILELGTIYLTLSRKVFPLVKPKVSGVDNGPTVATLASNMLSAGFSPTANVITNWLVADQQMLTKFGKGLVARLRSMVGGHVAHEPMYPNFPKQVVEASDAELILNALIHYFGDWAGVRTMPKYDKLIRPALPSAESVIKPIDLGSEEDFKQAVATMLRSSQAYSPEQKTIIRSLFAHASGSGADADLASQALWQGFPQKFVNRENQAFIGALIFNSLKESGQEEYFDCSGFDTATDALRLAAAFSGGDVSLAEKTRFTKLSRAQRRLLLNIINQDANALDNMFTRREEFKRLGERLHPGEYAKRYPNAFAAFGEVRNPNSQYRGFDSKVEHYLHVEPDFDKALALLVTRPGVLARRLNEILTAFPDRALDVADSWDKVVNDVSTAVLLQVFAYFNARAEQEGDERAPRLYIPKGNTARPIVAPDNRPSIDFCLAHRFSSAARVALVSRFNKMDALGKVYIDPAMFNVRIPFGLRNASKAFNTVGRGSALPLGDGSTLRFFIHWKNLGDDDDLWRDRVDIDLSASLLGEDFSYKGAVTYYDLREQGVYHSGDITSAPEGASEFIDVNISDALALGARYVVMNVHSYTRQPFAEVPECFAGFMMRDDVNSGEVFEPSTVVNKVDLTSTGTISTVMLFDLVRRQAIWVDMTLQDKAFVPNNDCASAGQTTSLAEALVNTTTASVGDLLSMHTLARGRRVYSPSEADLVVSVDGDLTPFDTARILGEFVV